MSLGHGIRCSSQASCNLLCCGSVKDCTANRIWMWEAGNWIFFLGWDKCFTRLCFKFTYNSGLGDGVILFVLHLTFFWLGNKIGFFSELVIVTNMWHSVFNMEDSGSLMPLLRPADLTCVSFGVTCRHLSRARQKIASVVTHKAVPRVPCLRPKARFEGTESVLLCRASAQTSGGVD